MQVHQQRSVGGHREPELVGAAGQMSHIVGEEPLQVGADVDPPRAHHLHPRPVRVVRARDDLNVGGAAAAHHEVADPHPQHLSEPAAGLGQQREQQPVAQVAHPVPAAGRDGAPVQDGLDLGGQQQRWPAAVAVATDPHQRRRARRAAPVQMAQQPPSRRPARRPPHQPARDRDSEHGLLPAIERDQRGQTRLQRPRRRHRRRGRRWWRQESLDSAPVAQPGQEPGHRRDADLAPVVGLSALFQERPPLGQRGRIAADRVRRPEVAVGLQPRLDRHDRLVALVDHRPGAGTGRGPHRHAQRHDDPFR